MKRGFGSSCRTALRLGALALAAACLYGGAQAATYKWTDEKGVVHYTDKLPPDVVDRASVQINKEGIPVKKTDPALTPEQRRAREQDEERRRQAARAQEEVARRDRALLASYTSESEIDLARARAVGTIDAVMQSSRSYSGQLERRKAEITQKIAPYRSGGKPVPPVFERELEGVTAELARQADLIAVKRQELAAVTAKYDADKARFHELKAAGITAADISAQADKAAPRK